MYVDVQVQVENDSILKISGERRREECEECEVKYIRAERQIGKFARKFNLPSNADLEHISAACHEGLLSVVVPKAPPPELRRPKNFDIKVLT
jgi:HSP20 family protein